MPTLDWIGLDKVINHHQDIPFRVLERKYSYDENPLQPGMDAGTAVNAMIAAAEKEGASFEAAMQSSSTETSSLDLPLEIREKMHVYHMNTEFAEDVKGMAFCELMKNL